MTSLAAGGRTLRHDRLHRVALANRVLKHYRLKVSDWSGTSYLVGSPTGETTVVMSMAEVWPLAEQMCKQPIDPLDERLIEALERS